MTLRRIVAAGFVALTLLIGTWQGAFAETVQLGTLSINQPWTRATPPKAAAAGGFVTVENTGDAPDRLLGAASSIAGRVEIHEMRMDNGTMIMRPVEGGIEIPAGGKATLAPGGLHIMFMELKEGLSEGQEVPVVLSFEQAGKVEVLFRAAAIGARSPVGGDEHGGHMDGKEMDGADMHDHGHGQ